jgi:replicative DNA helicase
MPAQLPAIDDIVFTPNEVAIAGTQYLDYRRNHQGVGIPVGLKSLDEDLLPALPGELISIIANPGNGKTGFMMRWARTRAQNVCEDNTRAVVYATWEQSIEELHAFNAACETGVNISDMARGRIDDAGWGKIKAYETNRINLPLWLIGHSMERRKKRPQLTMTALARSLDKIENWGKVKDFQIDILFIDYLQRIKFDDKPESQTIGYSNILDRLKDCALALGCPVIVGVQARREVMERKDPVPGIDDGQWTSNVEQSSDKVISLLRPSRYRHDGETMLGVNIQGNCQMLVSVLKQKLGKDNWSKWVYFDPAYNRLDELELRHIDLNIKEPPHMAKEVRTWQP